MTDTTLPNLALTDPALTDLAGTGPVVGSPVLDPPVAGRVTADEVRPGDLLFTARPSFLQQLCARAGEQWRHVGIVAVDEDGAVVTEVAGPRFSVRPLQAVLDTNELVAIARFGAPDQARAAAAAQRAKAMAGHDQVYAWDDVVLAGFIAATRRYVLATERAVLERAVSAAADAVHRDGPRDPWARSFTCSSFVLTALTEAGCPLHYDLYQPRSELVRPSLLELVRGRTHALRAGGGSRMSGRQLGSVVKALVTGVVAATGGDGPTPLLVDDTARWVTPGDLWRSSSLIHRHYISE